MLKMLVMAIYGIFLWNSNVALSEDMKTAEKWTCTRDDSIRLIRLYAPEKGLAPCKVFYYKRSPADPDDSAIESLQNSGAVKPIYYSTGNGEFCVRKLTQFKDERVAQGWNCVK